MFSHRLQVVGWLKKSIKIIVSMEALMQIILIQEHKDKNNRHKKRQGFNMIRPIMLHPRIRENYSTIL